MTVSLCTVTKYNLTKETVALNKPQTLAAKHVEMLFQKIITRKSLPIAITVIRL